MINLIIKCYLATFLCIGIGSLCLFLVGCYFIFRKSPKQDHFQVLDIAAIAGDDMMATQLDLARAYIESGKQDMAKKILFFITTQGSSAEKKEAQRLLGLI